MSFRLDQKPAVDAIRKKYHDERSSHTFDNLYVWRKVWKIDLYLEEDMYVASFREKSENTWYFPVGDDDCRKRFIQEQMKEGSLSFRYMSLVDAEFLQVSFPGKFLVERDRSHDEYIVRISDHLEDSGKKKQKFRCCWHRFLEYGPYTFLRVEKTNEPLVHEVLEKWYENKDCTQEDYLEMTNLEREAFFENQPEDYDKWVILAKEKTIGVITGYPISDDVYNVCIAKENCEIKYANYGIFRLLMEKLKDQYEFVNIEDDLDIPGLRTMKSRRLPCKMNEMWKAAMI